MGLHNGTSSQEIVNVKPNTYFIGAIAALTAMTSNGIVRILLKYVVSNKSNIPSEMPILYHSCGCLVISIAVPVFGGDQRILFPSGEMEGYHLWSWISLFIVGFVCSVQAFIRVAAIKRAGPVVISFVRTPEIIIAYLIQVTFFKTPLSLSSIIGSGCIIIACIGVCSENTILGYLPRKHRNIF